MLMLSMIQLVSSQVNQYSCLCYHVIVSKLAIDCLKCIAWKGRALVVGFAAGKIEKVSSAVSDRTVSDIGKATPELSAPEEHLHRRRPLGCIL